MKGERIKRVNERMLRELAAGLYRIAQGSPQDLAKISFVSVETSPDLHNAAVTVSVLGTPEDEARILAWLRDRRADFQEVVAKNVGLKYTPVLSFKPTHAIGAGARVLGILDELAAADGSAADPATP
ncbi:MAG: ribosome-binding factor A [Kiritimatiellae bacterium]|nr:ribosome-binding factor A [Kiritimatiellia bacterium]MBR1836356.1 ribosome-binding factor A [Kiritimatiellia bacterium]